MSDLDALPPLPQVLVLAGITLEITPIRVGEIPALLAAIRPFAHRLAAGDPDGLELLAEHGDALLDAVAVASRQPRVWVDGLALDEALRLATFLFEVNADFFTRQVLPVIQDSSTRLAARTPQAGLPSSTV